MIKNNLNKIRIKNIINFLFLFLFSFDALSQRVSNEDIHGGILSGGSDFFAIIIGLIVILFIIKNVISNKGFRLGVFFYIGVLLSIILIGKIFGKEVMGFYCLILAVILYLYSNKS